MVAGAERLQGRFQQGLGGHMGCILPHQTRRLVACVVHGAPRSLHGDQCQIPDVIETPPFFGLRNVSRRPNMRFPTMGCISKTL